MRARWLSLGVLLIVVAGGIVWLAKHPPKPQTITLPDGSQLTLVKITRGTNHIYRVGNRWQDFLYPLLPLKLRVKLSARVMEWDSFNRDSVMVWFRRDGPQTARIHLCAADEHGLESLLQLVAHTTRTTGSGAGTAATGTAATQISGWELAGFPKRARQFNILVYCPGQTELSRVGEFHISNPVRRKYPVWKAEPLPAIRRTNGLEIALIKLETETIGPRSGVPPIGIAARVFSRATFKVSENGARTEAWSVSNIRLTSATGEMRYGDRKGSQWWNGVHIVDVGGGIWLEEPAWKVDVDFARTADFPAEDLWGIQGMRVPHPGEMVERRVETNRHAVKLEFLGVSGLKNFPESKLTPAYAVIHIRTQHPLDRLRVELVEVRDERGRTAVPRGVTNDVGTGAGGNTPKESLTGFRIEIPEGAKSLDITLAATPIRHVEFLAKPVMTRPPLAD